MTASSLCIWADKKICCLQAKTIVVLLEVRLKNGVSSVVCFGPLGISGSQHFNRTSSNASKSSKTIVDASYSKPYINHVWWFESVLPWNYFLQEWKEWTQVVVYKQDLRPESCLLEPFSGQNMRRGRDATIRCLFLVYRVKSQSMKTGLLMRLQPWRASAAPLMSVCWMSTEWGTEWARGKKMACF